MKLIAEVLEIISSIVDIITDLEPALKGYRKRGQRHLRSVRRRWWSRILALVHNSPVALVAIVASLLLVTCIICSIALCAVDIAAYMPAALNQIEATEGSHGLIIAYTMIAQTIIVALGIAIVPLLAVPQMASRWHCKR